ncbi:Cof-type HAD-IIB family hydrolase [Spiroplasma poulsonii]|uniref:Pyridoxal phosphate phosphatase YbhA n=1 Tax=Spiroplasma poulsonii TaxID=2138 RepID=A0A2P6FD70_9MOLU|nr:Cof-type HAD-IIB family hydrolase [Spiroplasma poulsonii]KAF0850954.1 Pyridoxal phosphate phosphatase YbhA [Spiroplasma poulsonii]PQM31324.1 Pyridoxal phosphate phosphatase YbhA [Spiroplasma poulsonii]PWF96327.1 Pyridoxal phosphate phosphatase YbhA [Spiroplasma poulsonii]PWF99103.1 Pyridoxal phosphate phosphatase YbhA [Spiroplasma poulsonii]
MNLFKKYPYVINDLDGTITGEGYVINEETYEALQTYQLVSDYHLLLASGRLDLMAKEYFAKLKIKTSIISCNGALIRDPVSNEVLYQQTLPQDLAIEIITLALEHDVDHIVYTASMIYGHPHSKRIALMIKYNEQLGDNNYQIPLDIETNYLALLKNNNIQVLKILFPFNSTAELERVQFINEPFKDQVEGVFSQKDLFDIQALDIDKGNVFKKLCELKGYNPQQFIFYGDNFNDVELAKSVGYSVAMGNSVLELKKIANATTTSVFDNGVREHIFLPKYYQKNKLLSFYHKLKMFLNKHFFMSITLFSKLPLI